MELQNNEAFSSLKVNTKRYAVSFRMLSIYAAVLKPEMVAETGSRISEPQSNKFLDSLLSPHCLIPLFEMMSPLVMDRLST